MIETTQTQSQPSVEQINVTVQTQDNALIDTVTSLHDIRNVVTSWIPVTRDAVWIQTYCTWITVIDNLIASVPSSVDQAGAWGNRVTAICLTVRHHMRASA